MAKRALDSLGTLIASGRAVRGMSQEAVGEVAGVSRNWVQALERGDKVCTYAVLEKLWQTLEPEKPISGWLMAWMERHVTSSAVLDDVSTALALSDLDKSSKMLGHQHFRNSQVTPLTLRSFPYDFEPLTIVVGDRREIPPLTPGDLLAGSSSAEDLRYLMLLGLNDKSTIVRTDKQFVDTMNPETDIKEAFGSSNLLIVGSPFVSYLSRAMQGFTLFKWQPMPLMRIWYNSLSQIRSLNGSELRVFSALDESPSISVSALRKLGEPAVTDQRINDIRGLATSLRQGHREPLKELYRPTGAVDPLGQIVYPASRGVQRSSAIISLCRNPFSDSDRYVAITVAGVHLPGTVSALKAMATEDFFDDHPFGGVLDVYHPKGVEGAFWNWQTRPYTEEDIVKTIGEVSSANITESSFVDWSEQEIADALFTYRNFLHSGASKAT